MWQSSGMGIVNIVIFVIKGLYILSGLLYNDEDYVKVRFTGCVISVSEMHWNEELYDRRSSNCGDAGE